MAPRSSKPRTTSALWSAPAFPRPVPSFAGRRKELDRISDHIDREILFLVYGVAGIGKSEFVYQLVHEIRQRPAWADAVPLLLDVRPATTATRTLAELLAATGAEPEPRRGHATEKAHLNEQLDRVARALDERAYLLFIDNVQNLPAGPVADALGYLSRHVNKSRIIVATRRELSLPTHALPPVTTTLGPLDQSDATAMMAALAERMELPSPPAALLMRTTHGSPFHIRGMLLRQGSGASSLEESLGRLSASARRVLLAASVAQHPPTLQALTSGWSEDFALADALGELEAGFLLDRESEQLVLHDLIRETLLALADDDELSRAHRDAAALCLARLRNSDAPPLLLAVDAVFHELEAGRYEDAWLLIERFHAPLAASGSEHLLQGHLEQLREHLPARRVAIDLLIARGLVRASLIAEASRVLAQLDAERSPAEEARYCVLAGEVAQRRGDLARARTLFERAAELAPDAGARFRARLQLALAASFAGEGERARQVMDEALAEVTPASPRQKGRHGWVRTVSWMFEERFELAADEARRARGELSGSVVDDLRNRLAMLETLASIECDDMERARAAAALIDDQGLRRRVASLYRAFVSLADGEARKASAQLIEAYEDMRSHDDAINAYLAGYFGSMALAEIGRLGDALSLCERTAQMAREAGLHAPASHAIAKQAMLAAEAIQVDASHRLAAEALERPIIGPRSRATAHLAHAHAHAIAGNVTASLEEIDRAREALAAPEHERARVAIDIEQAAIELLGGNLERAVELSESAVAHYRERSRDYEVARARLVLAASYIARGRRTDLLFAEKTIQLAEELAVAGEMLSVRVGCAILSAALARHGNRDHAADELLANALCKLDPERGSLYANALLAAIEGGVAAWAMPGAVALLAHLGFSEAVDCYLVDQHGRRAATDADVERERAARELFVDDSRSVIVARQGEVEIRGRPMQCSLLSVLVQARGEPVSPETLYKRVWDAAEYHPLQHRNALYVAINRLRKTLRGALPDRELIERASAGWRLADGTDACAAVAVRGEAR